MADVAADVLQRAIALMARDFHSGGGPTLRQQLQHAIDIAERQRPMTEHDIFIRTLIASSGHSTCAARIICVWGCLRRSAGRGRADSDWARHRQARRRSGALTLDERAGAYECWVRPDQRERKGRSARTLEQERRRSPPRRKLEAPATARERGASSVADIDKARLRRRGRRSTSRRIRALV
jgi:hypothetical protein